MFFQQANQTPHEFPLNVDVQEFYPRVYSANSEPETKVNCDEPSADLACVQPETSIKPKAEAPKATKTSHSSKTSTGRVSKKEILEGIKSMEQQNIDLMASKPHTTKNASQNDEWNVIKKGKKVKVVKDVKTESPSSVVQEVKENEKEENKIEDATVDIALVPEAAKKSSAAPKVVKKVKGKGKKKKTHFLTKQDGFQIIEPDFNNVLSKDLLAADGEVTEVTEDISEEEEIAEQEGLSETASNGAETIEKVVLEIVERMIETDLSVRQVQEAESVAQATEIVEEKRLEEYEVQRVFKNVEDATIDISDEDVCRHSNYAPQELSVHQEIEPDLLKQVVNSSVVDDNKVEVEVAPEVQAKANPELKLEIEKKVQPNVEVLSKVENKQEVLVKQEVSKKMGTKTKVDPFQDMDFFNDDINIAALERDLMENLRLLDDDIELKSPIINPLYDFPITSAVQKWLHEKQSESFDSLFHVQNFKKLNEIFEDDDDDETESDISEKEVKSESDSDYASDFQAKANGSSPTCSSQAKSLSDKPSKCNKLIAAKESFCALM